MSCGSQRNGVEESIVKSSASACVSRVRGLDDQLGLELEVERGEAETVISLIATTGFLSGSRVKEVSWGTNRVKSKPPRVRDAGNPLNPNQVM